MALKEKIEQDLKISLKEKKATEVSVLRMLLAAILNKEKKKRYKLSKEKPDFGDKELEKESQLTEEEVIEVITSELKKRKEAIGEFERGERKDLVEKEKEEAKILREYLPEQLSSEEIKKLAKGIIKEVGARGMKDMGKVMGNLMPKVKGRVDGGQASKIVKELLK
jgi:uncharacterized protein YqeY